jgi:RNA recognition motif-containing protein
MTKINITVGLRALFSPIGNVESVKIVIDKATGVSLGYGFVVYENAVDAEKAVEALNGHEIASKKLKVGYAHAGRKDNSHL